MAGGPPNQPPHRDTLHAEIHCIRIQIMSNVGAIYPIMQGQSVQMRNARSRPSVEVFLAFLPQDFKSVNEPARSYIAGVLCNGAPFVQSPPRTDQKAAWEALLAATAELAGRLQGRLLIGTNGVRMEDSGGVFVGGSFKEMHGSSNLRQTTKREASAPIPAQGSDLSSFSLPEAVHAKGNFAQQVATPVGLPPYPGSFGGDADAVHSPGIYGGTIPVFPDYLTLN